MAMLDRIQGMFRKNGADDPATRALWVQEVTRRGVLILTTFNISAALDEAAVKTVLSAFAHAFKRVSEAKRLGIPPESWLDGPIPVPAFIDFFDCCKLP